MPYQVDIAQLLFRKAGEHLAQASSYSQKAKKPNLKLETEACIQAIVLFQSAMEAVITEEIAYEPKLTRVKTENEKLYAKYKSLSFRNRWERVFDHLQIKRREELTNYLDFYAQFRIPILHPISRYVTLDSYTFEKVYNGLKSGWNAMQQLNKALQKPVSTWTNFRRELHIH